MDRSFPICKALTDENYMQISILRDPADLDKVEGAWEKLSGSSGDPASSFSEYKKAVSAEGADMRLFVVENQGSIVAIAPFTLAKGQKHFCLGERRILSLPLRRLTLFNGTVLGDPDTETLRTIFAKVGCTKGFDLVDLGELEIGSALHEMVHALDRSWICTSPTTNPSIHWYIDLPSSFDEYLELLSPKTRKRVRRDIRIFDTRLEGDFRIFEDEAEVEEFLDIGESISRLTYQWNVGQRLVNDEPTRRAYVDMAKEGVLRCHLLFAHGNPCAFSRGSIRGGVYLYETPGFDPQYAKESPGIVLQGKVIKDLIERTDCRIFDFGQGGDLVGYKAKYGTRSVSCRHTELARLRQPYALFLVATQELLKLTKYLGKKIVGEGRVKQKLKMALRRYGG